MKRSEMISKIMACIINHNTPEQLHTRESAKYLANNLLNLIEENGMLPPYNSPDSWAEHKWDKE